jgi:hypothetical protein
MEEDTIWASHFHKEILKNINNENRIEWKLVSSHPYVPIRLIWLHPRLPWDWHNLSKLSFEKIEGLITAFPKKDWDWHHLSMSSPPHFIQNNPALKWKHDKISRRKYSFEILTTPLEYALKNRAMPWNWTMLSRHPSMTMDHLFNYPFLSWDMDHVFMNCPFSSHHLHYIATNNRNYHLLSKNPHNTLRIIRQNISKPWDWTELAQNIAFAPQNVYLYKDALPLWRWDLTLRNPRLTWSFYNIIRKETTIHRQFFHLLKNHFRHSNSFFVYFTIVIRRFFLCIIYRRMVLRKVKLLSVLKRKMNPNLLRMIITQYID